MPRIRVAVLATYPAVRAGLAVLLSAAGHDVLDDRDALDDADVLVTDAIDLVAREAAPAVLLSDIAIATPDVPAVLPRDASAAMIDAAVRAVHAGLRVTHPSLLAEASIDALRPSDLTPREIEVLHLLAAGMTNRGAAVALGISEHTVKFHVGSALAKLGARSRTEAVSIAVRMGLLPI